MKTLLIKCLTVFCLTLITSIVVQAQLGTPLSAASHAAKKGLPQAGDGTIEKMADYSDNLLHDGQLVLHDMQFRANSATVLPEIQSSIQAIAAVLKREPNLHLRIEAHTLAAGDATANLQLSQQRADAIRAALIAEGIAADRLAAQGQGESQPIYSDPKGHYASLNQRIEIIRQ